MPHSLWDAIQPVRDDCVEEPSRILVAVPARPRRGLSEESRRYEQQRRPASLEDDPEREAEWIRIALERGDW